jgi:hypothetical protein
VNPHKKEAQGSASFPQKDLIYLCPCLNQMQTEKTKQLVIQEAIQQEKGN